MTTFETDVAIVGGGPVGLSAVFALGQVGLNSIVIDALTQVGGQCAALYPQKPIYDIPSRMKVDAATLVEDLRRQAQPYAPQYLLGRSALDLSEIKGRYELELSDGTKVRCGAVIVAAGAGAFGPNRPPLPDIERFEGKSVHYLVQSPEDFRGHRVVIAGGGDSAADWAAVLAKIAARVTIIHRRRSFRAAPATLSKLHELESAGKIAICAPSNLQALVGREGQLEGVIIVGDEGAQTQLPADTLLCFFGLAKDLSAIASWGIGADRSGIPVEPTTMQTRRCGVFAIGDIASYSGKLKLILTGFAEAALAAHSARAHLYPDKTFHFEYSTSRGQPGALATPEGK